MKAFKAFHITHPETGLHRYVPGDDVPDEHVDLVDEEMQEIIFKSEEDRLAGDNYQSMGEGDADDEGDEYDSLTVPQLRALAKERDLNIDGARNKEDVKRRLREADVAD